MKAGKGVIYLCVRCNNLHGNKNFASYQVNHVFVCGIHLAKEVKEQLKVLTLSPRSLYPELVRA